MPQTLQQKYREVIAPQLQKELGLENIQQIPRFEKIVVSIGMGEAILSPQTLEKATEDLKAITAQQPLVTKAKSSIAGFKLRKGMKIGLKVTLRGDRMYTFFQRLVNIALPRVRDFQGISPKSFDRQGNFNLGLKEQIIFPEIDYDKIDRVRGLQITIVTSAANDEHAKKLLDLMGMPFRD